MRYSETEEQANWARQVPERRFRSSYQDYGWERRQSVLPEFRDPEFHFNSEERKRLAPWQWLRRGVATAWQGRPGPFHGKGPRGYIRSDERIYEEVCERMTRQGELDASNISVDVKDGEVTLAGEVPNRMAKRLAEDISNSVFGVKDVHNRLQLHKAQSTPDRWIDRVGMSGIYPASEAEQAPPNSDAQGMASWGQGKRGARGYEDHGESELHLGRTEEDQS